MEKLKENTLSSGTAASSEASSMRAPAQQYIILGHLDLCDNNGIGGWIAVENDSRPLAVKLIIDGNEIARTPANLFRKDLLDAGIGEGKHGFLFAIPEILKDGKTHILAVKEASTDVMLPGSPKTVMAKVDSPEISSTKISTGKSPRLTKDGQVLEPGIMFDQMIGPMTHGWSVALSETAAYLRLTYGSLTLGKLTPNQARPDVRQHFGLDKDELGFQLMTGGLLHFSAVSGNFPVAYLAQEGSNGVALTLNLANSLDQAYTFSPLKSFSRNGSHLGKMSSATCLPTGEFTLMLEAGTINHTTDNLLRLSFYQEKEAGLLTRLAQFDLPLTGQLARLHMNLISVDKPLLVVATDGAYEVILTDCFPYPAMYFEKYAALMEYHSLLARGQATFDVITKISRSHLDYWTDKHLGCATTPGVPARETTAVLVFGAAEQDIEPNYAISSFKYFGNTCVFIGRDGMVFDEKNGWQKLDSFLQNCPASHYLLCDATNIIRPDFWSIFAATSSDTKKKADVLYWESIWLDSTNRPLWVKNDVLSGAAFSDEELVPLSNAMISRDLLLEIGSKQLAALGGNSLQLINLLATVNHERIYRLPVVMDIRRLLIMPAMVLRMYTHQQELPKRIPASPSTNNAKIHRSPGVSVIINYRNGAPVTIECLKSLRLQNFDGPIEIILVDNGSTPSVSEAIHTEAKNIFGHANVNLINYSEQFNHSEQCNLASEQASHEYLFMLSNDSVLISKDVIARSVKIASVSSVGTCGYRIVKAHGDTQKLVSLGLTLSNNKYLFAGAAPLSTHRPPNSLLPYTQSSNGNTFAAVMLRKEVYEELGGLDSEEFPTDYNDVDFCLRATNAGYSHITIGGALISHNGRGSREMNLDLPVNPLLIERMPALATMLQSFSVRVL